MPPVRMVEGGVLRSDIEADWLRRSRTAAQNAIDLRAKIAANTVMQQRVSELVERYGPDTVAATMERIIDSVEARLRGILREIPDGSWSEETYLDYYDRGGVEIYACRLTLTKQGDSLVFDFSGSSRQAPGGDQRDPPRARGIRCAGGDGDVRLCGAALPGGRGARLRRCGPSAARSSIAIGRQASARGPRRARTRYSTPSPVASAGCSRTAGCLTAPSRRGARTCRCSISPRSMPRATGSRACSRTADSGRGVARGVPRMASTPARGASPR